MWAMHRQRGMTSQCKLIRQTGKICSIFLTIASDTGLFRCQNACAQKRTSRADSIRFGLSVLHAQRFHFRKIGKCVFSAPSRLDKRGVRVVTNAGRDAVDAVGVARRAALEADGEVAWSWRPGAGAKFLRSKLLRSDGGKRARSPGRARISRKTIARGMPGDSGVT